MLVRIYIYNITCKEDSIKPYSIYSVPFYSTYTSFRVTKSLYVLYTSLYGFVYIVIFYMGLNISKYIQLIFIELNYCMHKRVV